MTPVPVPRYEREPGCVHEVVFGSRDGVAPEWVRKYVRELPKDTVVISGMARGVDMVSFLTAYEMWSRSELAGVEGYPAQWNAFEDSHNRRMAGPERNRRMARLADSGQGFRNRVPKWSGTDGMAQLLRAAKVPVKVWRVAA
jgi:hypothetical protein